MKPHHRRKLVEVVKFAFGCAGSIVVKLGVTAFFTWLMFPVWLGYLGAQIAVLITGYWYHSSVTFRTELRGWKARWNNFLQFMFSVLGFKIADYLLVVVGIGFISRYLEAEGSLTPWMRQLVVFGMIVAVSGVIFFIRFYFYQIIFQRKAAADECGASADSESHAYYTGEVKSVFTGYSAIPDIRANASSGGIVTGLFDGMLSRGKIDGVLVWQLAMENGAMRAIPQIACCREDLIAAQGSIYFSFPALTSEVMQQIRNFSGRLAIVGLPCTIKALRHMMKKDPVLKDKIVLLVGLFCSHTSQKKQIETVLTRKGIDLKKAVSFCFRRGNWRGEAEVVLTDGSRFCWPTSCYKLYQNLFIQCHAPCMSCSDHFAEAADVSVGDIWLMSHRSDKVKHSIAASRTDAGEMFLEQAQKEQELLLQPENPCLLYQANKRAVVFHKAIRARALVGRWLGMQIRVPENARRARWNEVLAAMMIMPVYRFSVSKRGAMLYRVPRIVLKTWLYGFKLLTNF